VNHEVPSVEEHVELTTVASATRYITQLQSITRSLDKGITSINAHYATKLRKLVDNGIKILVHIQERIGKAIPARNGLKIRVR
jgi:hypothetical protein